MTQVGQNSIGEHRRVKLEKNLTHIERNVLFTEAVTQALPSSREIFIGST